MQRKTIIKILISITVILLVTISSTVVFAIQPKNITGTDIELNDLSFMDDITELIRLVGTFIAVGVLMVIGIRYMMGSLEEKAAYKKSMMPYVIGCFILFGAANIAPQVGELITNIGGEEATAETIGNSILGIIQVIGTIASVGILMIMGIKYMAGSAEAKAAYKKTMVPFIIGAIFLFAAVNIVSMIYSATQGDNHHEGGGGRRRTCS